MLMPLHAAIRRRPRLRAALLPWWIHLRHLGWHVRNIVTLRSPVMYPAGGATAMLYPEGQIPQVLWEANFEENERDFVVAYLRPGMRVINVGANVGLYAVLASILVGQSGLVHVFEPSSLTFARLQRNLKLNKCRNVIASRIALSDANGTLVLRVDSHHPSYDGHRFVEKTDSIPHLLPTDELVECHTLDEYLAERGKTTFDLMIIDVEGAEYAVLKGAMNALAQKDATLMLECSKNQVETEALLRGMGYRFWSWDKSAQILVSADFRALAEKGNVIARRQAWSSPG